MEYRKFKKRIFELISKGELSRAIDLLLELDEAQIADSLIQDIVAFSYQYREIEKKELMGLPVELSHKNRIVTGILKITGEIKNEDLLIDEVKIVEKKQDSAKIKRSNSSNVDRLEVGSLSLSYKLEEQFGRMGIHFKSSINYTQESFNSKIDDTPLVNGLNAIIETITGVSSKSISVGISDYSCGGENQQFHINKWRSFIIGKDSQSIQWQDIMISIHLRRIVGYDSDFNSGLFKLEFMISKELDGNGFGILDTSESAFRFLKERYSQLKEGLKEIFTFEYMMPNEYEIRFTEPKVEDILFPQFFINGIICNKEYGT